jgi:head-tail adaptor
VARRQYPQESGERDRAVTVQRLTSTKGPSGFPVETWTTLLSPYWVKKMDASSRERFANGQLSASFDTRWEGSYHPDIDPETVDVAKTRRLVYQGRTHDIVSATMIGMREGVELLTLARMG